jgi:hypothetical protein
VVVVFVVVVGLFQDGVAMSYCQLSLVCCDRTSLTIPPTHAHHLTRSTFAPPVFVSCCPTALLSLQVAVDEENKDGGGGGSKHGGTSVADPLMLMDVSDGVTQVTPGGVWCVWCVCCVFCLRSSV